MKYEVIIIGNGFDLHHQYPTDYRSFFEKSEYSQDSEIHAYYKLIERAHKYLEEDSSSMRSNSSWTYIEESIAKTRYFVANELSNHVLLGKEIPDIDVPQFIQLQMDVAEKFKSYMDEVTSQDNGVYNDYLDEVLKNSNFVINFNYTNIVQTKYGVQCYHPHGTLKEDHILLGHLMDSLNMEYMDVPHSHGDYRIDTFAKHFLRMELEFMRFLSHYNLSEEEKNDKKALIRNEVFKPIGPTGHGPGYELEEIKLKSKKLYEFTKTYKDFGEILTNVPNDCDIFLTVIGHGIIADQDLYEIFANDYSVKQIKLIVDPKYDCVDERNLKRKYLTSIFGKQIKIYFYDYCGNKID